MSDKQERQRRILNVVASRSIGTQKALSDALSASGISSTQSTLSKDLKQLGIVKAPDGAGGLCYRAPTDESRQYGSGSDLLARELRDFVVETGGAGHTLVVKTITGHAQGVCEAIDRAGWTEVVGTIAGENTIFILCQSVEKRERLKERILEISQ
ncbi:MAG: hypothetical protein OXU79_19415 [Gemmatimonadota bacterium]|nr:hypothetical protein [Gemmatimonadota bacterium]